MLQVHDPLPIGQAADRLDYARQILRAEAAALEEVAVRLDDSFLQAVNAMYACRGRIGITGVGKSADIGHKIAGTLNSTGTRAYFLDAARAVHGDLGAVDPHDLILILSLSGESEEIIHLLGPLASLASTLVALTGNGRSTLARAADIAIVLGALEEVCPLGLAPSTSTTAMMAIGDALAFVLSRMREFTREDFARYHPAGSLGRKLLTVDGIMRTGDEMRIAAASDTVREVFARARRRGRRTGAVILVDEEGMLCGLFTDSDLARLFEQRRDAALDRPIREVMTPKPLTVLQATRVAEAVEILQRHRISELPVVDEAGRPVGLVDITDVVSLIPPDEAEPLGQVA
jgi:arabinose-5-phosphate isomerase